MQGTRDNPGTEVLINHIKTRKPGKILRILLILFGFLCLSIGIAGIFLPIVPTTPLVLLAGACFLRSSEKLYSWIIKNKTFGKYIQGYLQTGRVPAQSKPISIILVWVFIGVSTIFAEPPWIKIVLIVIACGVSIHLVLLKTIESSEYTEEQYPSFSGDTNNTHSEE